MAYFIKKCRINPEQYKIIEQNFTDFLDFKSLYLSKISKDVKMSKIKTATFLKDCNQVINKTSFCNDVEHSFN